MMSSEDNQFWDERDVSLGVPVGCLVVQQQDMGTVKKNLSLEGKSGRGVWLRPKGTVPRKEDVSCFEVHLTVFGATILEREIFECIPPPVRELLQNHRIQWESGKRLQQSKPASSPPNTTEKNSASVKPAMFGFCELFAGIGGFRLALESLGGDCVFSSEVDKYAAETYHLNFGDLPSAGDITTVPTEQIPPYDILVGGFPCQSFSTAGFQQGLHDHQTTNGRLYLEVCRVLCATKPKAFLLENVANLFIMDGGKWHEDPQQRQPGKTYTTILTAFEKCGYIVQTQVVNAANHHVPQHRDRLFFVGFRDSKTARCFRWPSNSSTCQTENVRTILEDYNSTAVRAAMLTDTQYQRMQHFLKKSAGRSCRAVRLDGIARTLMASYRAGWQKHSEFIVSSSGDSARFYTAREAARIMGFPDTYTIPGHPTREKGGKAYDAYQRFYHQIGNAVCPPVIKAIAESMLCAMNNMSSKKRLVENDPDSINTVKKMAVTHPTTM